MAGSVLLIVVDDPAHRLLFNRYLGATAHHLVYSANGEDAFDRFGEVKPDLVIAHVDAPRLDGPILCQLIRQQPRGEQVPFVLLSEAFSSSEIGRARAEVVGADGFLPFPFDRQKLIEQITPLLAFGRLEPTSRKLEVVTSGDLPRKPPEGPALQLDRLRSAQVALDVGEEARTEARESKRPEASPEGIARRGSSSEARASKPPEPELRPKAEPHRPKRSEVPGDLGEAPLHEPREDSASRGTRPRAGSIVEVAATEPHVGALRVDPDAPRLAALREPHREARTAVPARTPPPRLVLPRRPSDAPELEVASIETTPPSDDIVIEEASAQPPAESWAGDSDGLLAEPEAPVKARPIADSADTVVSFVNPFSPDAPPRTAATIEPPANQHLEYEADPAESTDQPLDPFDPPPTEPRLPEVQVQARAADGLAEAREAPVKQPLPRASSSRTDGRLDLRTDAEARAEVRAESKAETRPADVFSPSREPGEATTAQKDTPLRPESAPPSEAGLRLSRDASGSDVLASPRLEGPLPRRLSVAPVVPVVPVAPPAPVAPVASPVEGPSEPETVEHDRAVIEEPPIVDRPGRDPLEEPRLSDIISSPGQGLPPPVLPNHSDSSQNARLIQEPMREATPSSERQRREAMQSGVRRGLDESQLGKRLAKRVRTMYRMLDEVDYYQILGVDPEASFEVLKRAYFDLSLEFHPDRFFLLRSGDLKEKIYAIYRRITEAYSVLSDERRRHAYDLARAGSRDKRAAPELRADELRPAPPEPSDSGLVVTATGPKARRLTELARVAFDEGDLNGARLHLHLALAYEDSAPIRAAIDRVVELSRP